MRLDPFARLVYLATLGFILICLAGLFCPGCMGVGNGSAVPEGISLL